MAKLYLDQVKLISSICEEENVKDIHKVVKRVQDHVIYDVVVFGREIEKITRQVIQQHYNPNARQINSATDYNWKTISRRKAYQDPEADRHR